MPNYQYGVIDVGTIIILVLMFLILYIAMKYLRGPRNEDAGIGGFVRRPFGTGEEGTENSASEEQDTENEPQE